MAEDKKEEKKEQGAEEEADVVDKGVEEDGGTRQVCCVGPNAPIK